MPRDRPRLWESFKRALGGPPPVNAPEPEVKARQRDLAPPFLFPDSVSPAPVSARAHEIDSPPTVDPESEPALPAVEVPASRSPRMARGLASFSRDNAKRERKFRHILSDGDADGEKQ